MQACYKQAEGAASFSFKCLSGILEALASVHDILSWLICLWGYLASSEEEFPKSLQEGLAAHWGDLHAHSATQTKLACISPELHRAQWSSHGDMHLLKSFAMQIFSFLALPLFKLHRKQTTCHQNIKHCWLMGFPLCILFTSAAPHQGHGRPFNTSCTWFHKVTDFWDPLTAVGVTCSCTEPRQGLTGSS